MILGESSTSYHVISIELFNRTALNGNRGEACSYLAPQHISVVPLKEIPPRSSGKKKNSNY